MLQGIRNFIFLVLLPIENLCNAKRCRTCRNLFDSHVINGNKVKTELIISKLGQDIIIRLLSLAYQLIDLLMHDVPKAGSVS